MFSYERGTPEPHAFDGGGAPQHPGFSGFMGRSRGSSQDESSKARIWPWIQVNVLNIAGPFPPLGIRPHVG